jgi:putative Ca2+/H+ antiporter (TMEM165/GDT1 family)
LAASLGSWAAGFVSPGALRYGLALCFFAFAIWLLIPDKADEEKASYRFGPFLSSLFVFFLAEMGDKTQLATIALAARYESIVLVTIGSTLGMLAANGLAVFFGDRLTRRIPITLIHRLSAALFVLYGVGILIGLP